MNRPKLSAARQKTLAEMWMSSIPASEIAKHFGLSSTAVDNYRRRMELKPRMDRLYKLKLSAAQQKTLAEMWMSSIPVSEIAKHFGLALVTVYAYRRRMGLKLRGGQGQSRYNISEEPLILTKRILLARKLRLKGWTWKRIAKRIGASEQLLSSELRRAYNPPDDWVSPGGACMRWDAAIKGLSPRVVLLLGKYGRCLSQGSLEGSPAR